MSLTILAYVLQIHLVMNPNALLIETMKTLTFGVEIETVNATRKACAEAVVKAFPGATLAYEGGYYDKWSAVLPDGRKWTAMSDASLRDASGRTAEVVTPICTWADLDGIQAVVRELRKAGAKVNASCGVHVHVGTPADRFDTAALTRLAKLVYQQEPLIVKALDVAASRLGHYTKPVDETFIRRIASTRPPSSAALATAWYGSEGEALYARSQHYHGSRYRGLNMHSVFFRGTVEFRYFEATLHAGQIKAYAQFCLALAAKALKAKGAMARKRTFNPATAKYDFRVFLLRLGLIGDEFKTARLHLMAKLEGSSSYKHGAPRPAAGFTPAEAASFDAYVENFVPTPSPAQAAPSAPIEPPPVPSPVGAPQWF